MKEAKDITTKKDVMDVQLYALNVAPEDGRILSATKDQYGAEGQPRVDRLPDDDISDYKYIDGEYIFDPLPKPPEPEPEPAMQYVTYDELAEAIKEGVNSYGE
mgnify:CR=1 FL=1